MAADFFIAHCDWKNPGEMIKDLIKQLPKFGLYAYNINTGGDSYAILISKKEMTEVEAQKLWNDEQY